MIKFSQGVRTIVAGITIAGGLLIAGVANAYTLQDLADAEAAVAYDQWWVGNVTSNMSGIPDPVQIWADYDTAFSNCHMWSHDPIEIIECEMNAWYDREWRIDEYYILIGMWTQELADAQSQLQADTDWKNYVAAHLD